MTQNVRCKNCNKLLARASFHYIEIKCPRCKTLNQITSVTNGAIVIHTQR
ncbi:Com family DNA-binding transcriptional regulator, partial [Escherichia coli]